MSHRRRALLLGGLALVLGGLAAFNVAGREAALEARVGGLVDIVVAREPIAAGTRVRAGALAIRRVPERFAPAGRIGDPRAVLGQRAAADILAGTDVTAGLIGDPAGAGRRSALEVPHGERIAQLVALGSPELVVSGSRVDVLVTPEPPGGAAGVALLALEDVEVLAATPVAAGEAPAGKSAPGSRVAVSLRVTLRQAVYLAAVQDFAREVRLLPRTLGDRARGRAGLRMGAELP